MEIEEASCKYEALPLLSLNHVSVLCKSVSASIRFYEQVLGFVAIKRPSSFDFNGAWLYNYGIGIHLIENPQVLLDVSTTSSARPIDPKDNHISFECCDVGLVKKRLEKMGMKYVSAKVEEEGEKVDQVFFHDPDGYMIEICNCSNIPVVPLSSSSTFKSPPSNTSCRLMENLMMENLSLDMINFSF
ncbi:Lactoylglutathione lyase / glyoxalase I family protein [Euphorbia peplus]|nr:Lactoylglutathione lyase / glyoxalase I family protein [Euphorbia peplus]